MVTYSLKESFKGINNMRDYTFYIEKAKKEQNFVYDNQLNLELGFKGSVCAQLRKNKMHLSEEKMIELAKLANESPLIALIDLNIMRSENNVKEHYKEISKGLEKTVLFVLITWVLTVLPSAAQAATSGIILTSSVNSIALIMIYIITSDLDHNYTCIALSNKGFVKIIKLS